MKWWRQLLPSNNQWEYDVAQPPLVYNTKIGGQTRRVVSVATKEGTWFAFDARTGQPFHQRVKVIDRVEHPPLKPGQPVTIFPGSIGGLNYSPAAFDPKTELRLQRGRGDGGRPDPGSAQPDAEEAQAPARRRLPRASERQLRRGARRVEGPRLDQRDQRVDRPPRLEVQHAGAGARRRDGDRQRARLRGWRRRCPARLRPHQREGPLDVPDRPPDRSRADDLHRRREGVHRDHRRRHADVLGRRPRLAAAGVRDRREQDRVAEAALDVVGPSPSRRRPRRRRPPRLLPHVPSPRRRPPRARRGS